jgi:hypothetical protein
MPVLLSLQYRSYRRKIRRATPNFRLFVLIARGLRDFLPLALAAALRRYGEARGALEAAVGYAVENNSGQCRHGGIQWAVSNSMA